jgi:hypothetical protein
MNQLVPIPLTAPLPSSLPQASARSSVSWNSYRQHPQPQHSPRLRAGGARVSGPGARMTECRRSRPCRLEASLTLGDDTRGRLLDALLHEALVPTPASAAETVIRRTEETSMVMS